MRFVPDVEKSQRSRSWKQQQVLGSQSQCQSQTPMFQDALMPINRNLKIRPNYMIQYGDKENERNMKDLLPASLYDRMYEFQRQGVQHGIKNYGRLLIVKGVGKTIQALAIAYVYKDHWPLLVICPSLLMLNWKDEATKWIDDVGKLDDIQVIFKQKDQIDLKARIIITSYNLAVSHADKFDKIKIAIADEAHHLKSCTSKRSQLLVPLLKRMRHVLLLTGTPALAKPREIYNLVQIIRPDVFYNFRDFGNRYCDPTSSRYKSGFDYEGCSNPIELNKILTNNIMIRRLKKDVLDQLPSKIRQNIKIEVDKTLKKQIQAIMGDNSDQIDRAFGGGGGGGGEEENEDEFQEKNFVGSSLEVVSKCYMLTGLSKVDGICEYLEEIIDDSSDQKFIIFAHHLAVLDKIEQNLQQNKWNYMRIDGKVPIKERHSRVQQFQTNPSVKIALLSLTAASVGITLTEASTVIFAEIHWTPGVMQQAEDRAHRIGQKNCVNCIYLIGEQTLDDRIMQIIQKKQSNVSYMLDGGLRKLYNEEIDHKSNWMPKSKIEVSEQKQMFNQQEYPIQKPNQQKVRTIDSFFTVQKSVLPSDLTLKKKPQEIEELIRFIDDLYKPPEDNTTDDIFTAIEEQIKRSASKIDISQGSP